VFFPYVSRTANSSLSSQTEGLPSIGLPKEQLL
jgi:hypothetical protein